MKDKYRVVIGYNNDWECLSVFYRVQKRFLFFFWCNIYKSYSKKIADDYCDLLNGKTSN